MIFKYFFLFFQLVRREIEPLLEGFCKELDMIEETSRAEQTAILAACHEEHGQESLPCLASLEEEVDTGEEREQVEDQFQAGIQDVNIKSNNKYY